MNKYPEIESLDDKIMELNLRFHLHPETKELSEFSFRMVDIQFDAHSYSIPVEDEFGDAQENNPALLLQLILQNCEYFTDAEDFLTWAKSLSLDSSNPVILDIYRELSRQVPDLLKHLGEVERISDWDMQMNAGAAQALRNMNP